VVSSTVVVRRVLPVPHRLRVRLRRMCLSPAYGYSFLPFVSIDLPTSRPQWSFARLYTECTSTLRDYDYKLNTDAGKFLY
jgi:hypothetical protein